MCPVLITGPNGAGKEVIADIVHANSTVKTGPYVKVNVGALPDTLMEAELFGTEAGAFTGAKARTGRFEAADGGTIFLDEIGNLSALGPGEAPARAPDRRVRAARLEHDAPHPRPGDRRDERGPAAAHQGREVPRGPLLSPERHRARSAAARLAAGRHRAARASLPRAGFTLSQDALRALGRYHWPGNVRELRNVIHRACLLSVDSVVTARAPGAARVPGAGRRLAHRPRGDRTGAFCSPTGSSRMPRATSACRARRSIAGWRSSASRPLSTRAVPPRTASRAAGSGATLPSGPTGGCSMKALRLVPVLLAALAALPSHAEPGDRERVTALADRFVDEYQKSFPISYGFSGLPVKRNDGVDINAPADVARWHALTEGMAAELAAHQAGGLRGRTGMGDLAVPRPRLQAGRGDDGLPQRALDRVPDRLAGGALADRGRRSRSTRMRRGRQALARWRDFGPWFDREIANLKEGQRLGYSATAGRRQLDAEPARPDARAEAGRVAPDGSGDPRQDAAPSPPSGSQVIEGTRVAGDHALSRFPAWTDTSPTRASRASLEGMPDGRRVLSRARIRYDDRGCRSGRALRRGAEGSGTRARHRDRPRAQAVRREGDRLEIAGRHHPCRPAREIRVRRRDPRLHAAHLRAGAGRGRQDGADAARRQGRDRAIPGVPAGERAGRPVPAGGR